MEKILDEETEFALLQRFLVKKPIGNIAISLRRELKHEGFSASIINQYIDEISG
jgi:hypothetical protein